MSSAHTRVLVVGAGPAGTATALRLAQLGITSVALLDTADFPRDKTCGSGLSPATIKLLKELEVWEKVEPLAYPITGIRLGTRGGGDLTLSGGDANAAAVLLRRDLDFQMFTQATAHGVQFHPHVHVREPIVEGDRWVGVRARDGREFRADYTVVANGSKSVLTFDPRPKNTIHTIMGWWEDIEFQPHTIEMLFVKELAPFYGWLFPETPQRVNIGITYEDPPDGKTNARELFQTFLDNHFGERLRTATQLGKWKGHPISYTYNVAHLHSPGRVIVGEAGRMVHPITAEGISYAMRSGIWAAEALRSILIDGRNEDGAFKHYEHLCQLRCNPAFWFARAFREVVQTPALDWAVDAAKHEITQMALGMLLARM